MTVALLETFASVCVWLQPSPRRSSSNLFQLFAVSRIFFRRSLPMAPLADDVWIFNAPMLRGLDRTVDLPQDRLQTVLHLFLMSKRFPTTAIEEILQRLSLQAALQRGWRLGTFNDIEESVLLVQENDEKGTVHLQIGLVCLDLINRLSVPVIPQVQGIVCKYKEISVKQKGTRCCFSCHRKHVLTPRVRAWWVLSLA